MKKNVMRKCGWMAAVAAVCLLPCVAVAAEATPLGVLDPEDATAYLTAGAQIFKGDLVKQGPGTNVLSLADVHTLKGRVVVADGVLSLTGATTANEPPKPLEVLTNAAVWLDASLPGTIDFVEGSTANVSEWRDVRETGDGTTANPYLYTRAVSFTNLEHHATYAPDPNGWFPTYSPAANGENAYVDFGPSAKSVKRVCDKVHEHTHSRNVLLPVGLVVKRVNKVLKGWGAFYSVGYPSRAFRKVNHYVLKRMARFLNRKSQRYYRLKFADTYYGEMTHYGLYRLAWADVRRIRN